MESRAVFFHCSLDFLDSKPQLYCNHLEETSLDVSGRLSDMEREVTLGTCS